MTSSCYAVGCVMLCHEFLLLSSHVKHSAADRRLQCEVSCWLRCLGHKRRQAQMESRQISSSRKKDVKNHIRTFVLMYFLLWFCEVCISSTNIKNMGPYSSASAPLQLDLEQAWLFCYSIKVIRNLWKCPVKDSEVMTNEPWRFPYWDKNNIKQWEKSTCCIAIIKKDEEHTRPKCEQASREVSEIAAVLCLTAAGPHCRSAAVLQVEPLRNRPQLRS